MTPTVDLDRYWLIVRACLTNVYDIPDGAMLNDLHRLADSLEAIYDHRDIFYHSAPLNVAADMVGHYGPLSDEQMRRYDLLVEQIDAQTKPKKAVRKVTAKSFTPKLTVPEKALAVR